MNNAHHYINSYFRHEKMLVRRNLDIYRYTVILYNFIMINEICQIILTYYYCY